MSTVKLSVLGIFFVFLAAAAAKADMTGHGGQVTAIDVSPDGTRVLTAGFDYSARFWRLDDHTEITRLDGHEGPVKDAVILGAGNAAATVGADGNLILWDAEKTTPRMTLPAHRGRAMAIAAAGDGGSVLTGGWDGRLILWDAATGDRLREIDTHHPIVGVAFADRDRLLVAAQNNGTIRLFRPGDGIQTGEFTAHDLGTTALAMSPNGRHLATIGLDNVLRIWRLDDFRQQSAFLPDPEIKPLAVTVMPDSNSAVVAYFNGDIRQISLQTGKTIRVVKSPGGPVWAVAVTPDGRFVLAAGHDERVRMWHLDTGDQIGAAAVNDDRPTPWLTSDHPGARLYRKCANCHALDQAERQRSGPHFKALFGRRAGSVPDYRYSAALKSSNIVWTRATIADLFRRGPDKVFPGTKMPVQLISDDSALEDLLDYLEEIAKPER